MKILVTGADGFLGQTICKKLEQNNLEVYKVCGPKKIEHKPYNITDWLSVDITKIDSVNKLKNIKKVDVLIHCAGLAHQFDETAEHKFREVNIKGTENIARIAISLGVRKFIHISSVSVYGHILTEKGTKVTENSICKPQNPYAVSKFEAEKICQSILNKTKTNLTILRLSTVIGEGDLGNVSRLIKLIDQYKFIWIGNGKNKKSLVYKEDVARAIVKIIYENSNRNELYNLTNDPCTMIDIVKNIKKNLDKFVIPFKIPANLILVSLTLLSNVKSIAKLENVETTIKKWINDDLYDGETFKKDYNFGFKTPISEALKKEVQWYLSQK